MAETGGPSLHVTNGDIVVDLLRRVRTEFLAGADGIDPVQVRRRFEERDRALAANRDGRYELWFEADLYDQLQIAQILARLAELGVAPERVTLVCIGEHPGIAHFGGLGQLEPGRRVLAGEADHVALNGIDRWVGGVHLRGPAARWRWDEGTESVTRAAA